jgi:hypothetical protein
MAERVFEIPARILEARGHVLPDRSRGPRRGAPRVDLLNVESNVVARRRTRFRVLVDRVILDGGEADLIARRCVKDRECELRAVQQAVRRLGARSVLVFELGVGARVAALPIRRRIHRFCHESLEREVAPDYVQVEVAFGTDEEEVLLV